MLRIPVLKPKDVIKVLEKAGFLFVRSRGSHRIYIKGQCGVTIPYHGKDMRKGTLKQIIRQSGLSLEDFLNK